MEIQVLKPKPEKRKLKYYSVPVEPKKTAEKAGEFFFIGNDKKVTSLLLSNFDSGFCSENLEKGSQILEMLISREINLPDVLIIQDVFKADELNSFLLKLQSRIQAIPVIIEGSSTATNE